jgi:hypothetical protein
MNSWYHAVSSSKKWGGAPELYLPVHEFIDSSKQIVGDVRHRSMYHHTQGIWLCQEIFGRTLQLEAGKKIPVRLVAELHVEEDLGWIPSPKDYIDGMELKQWMGGPVRKQYKLTQIFPVKEYYD